MRYLICDDVNEKEFYKLEKLKEKFPNFKVTCFVMGKDAGDYLKKDWIEVGCHGWEHDYPPECERDDREYFILKGFLALKEYMRLYNPYRLFAGYRAPGFQITASTYPILKSIFFGYGGYIAHQNRIQPLNESDKFNQGEMINTHIYDNSLEKVKDGEFHFLSEGFN